MCKWLIHNLICNVNTNRCSIAIFAIATNTILTNTSQCVVENDAFTLFSYQLTPPTVVACGDNSIAAHMFVLVLVLKYRFKAAAFLTLLAPVITVFMYFTPRAWDKRTLLNNCWPSIFINVLSNNIRITLLPLVKEMCVYRKLQVKDCTSLTGTCCFWNCYIFNIDYTLRETEVLKRYSEI